MPGNNIKRHTPPDWLEHVVPWKFLRALWDALFPSRFERLVVDGLDGTPPPEYARPVTFSLGCWLLLFVCAKEFPWTFVVSGPSSILTSLPAADRHLAAEQIGLAKIKGLTIPDSGPVTLHGYKYPAMAAVLKTLDKPFGRITPGDVAQYFEEHGNKELASESAATQQRRMTGPLHSTKRRSFCWSSSASFPHGGFHTRCSRRPNAQPRKRAMCTSTATHGL